MSTIIIYSIIAGVVGTGLGGLIGAVVGKKSDKIISIVLSIAGGVMLAVVFFDLIPQCTALSNNNMLILLGLSMGILTMIILNAIVEHFDNKVKVTVLALQRNKDNITDRKKLKSAGIFFALAIAIHNVPEGLAIGASGAVNMSLGLTMAVIICVHNIPEGMAISLPLVAGNVSKWKAIFASIVAGAMTILGAVIGVIIGGANDDIVCLSLAFAGGAMLQVVFCDMIPSAVRMDKNNVSYYCIIIGVLLGFVINFLV